MSKNGIYGSLVFPVLTLGKYETVYYTDRRYSKRLRLAFRNERVKYERLRLLTEKVKLLFGKIALTLKLALVVRGSGVSLLSRFILFD